MTYTISDELKKLIQESDYVSFDIFDTLILRSVSKPVRVFDWTAKRYAAETGAESALTPEQIHGFREARMAAERHMREKKQGLEVTLEEIYGELDYPQEAKNCLKQQELELEYAVCHRNPGLYEVYRYSLAQGKKVIIASDMYLPEAWIAKILRNCGYAEYEKLYLSSSIGYRKKDGRMFDVICQELQVKPEQILHIGDNANSDIKVPRQRGLKVWQVVPDKKVPFYTQKPYFSSELVNGYLNCLPEVDDFSKKVGRNILGPILYGFAAWLQEQVQERNPEKIIFLSRDGAVMKAAYDLMTPEDGRTQYAYASRRALIVPSLSLDCTLENIQKSIHMRDRMQLQDVLERIGLSVSQCEDAMKKHGLKAETHIRGTALAQDEKFVSFFGEIQERLYENAKQEYEAARAYWKAVIKDARNIFIVDIGWNGNMQNALNRLMAEEIEQKQLHMEGYYLGVNPDTIYNFPMHGYIYEKGRHESYKKMMEHFTDLFESLFMTDHGSVLKYEMKDGAATAALLENEYATESGQLTNEMEHILNMQQAALDFVAGIKAYLDQVGLEYQVEDAMANMLNLGLSPSKEIAAWFGDFRFFNPGLSYLARPSKGTPVPGEVLNTNWRIGYLKRSLGAKLPYWKLANLIKKAKRFVK